MLDEAVGEIDGVKKDKKGDEVVDLDGGDAKKSELWVQLEFVT